MALRKRKKETPLPIIHPLDSYTVENVINKIKEGMTVRNSLKAAGVSSDILIHLVKNQKFLEIYKDYRKARSVKLYEKSVEDVAKVVSTPLEVEDEDTVVLQKKVLDNADKKYELTKKVVQIDSEDLFGQSLPGHGGLAAVNINIATDPKHDRKLIDAFTPVVNAEGSIVNKSKEEISETLKDFKKEENDE